jgi:type IV pilus assembly protein PilB
MEDPMNEEGLRDCTATSGLPARAMIAAPSDIFRVLRLHYGSTMGLVAATSAVVGAAPIVAASVANAAAFGAPPVRVAPVPRAASNGANIGSEAASQASKDAVTRPEGVAVAAPVTPAVPDSQVTPATGSGAVAEDSPAIESNEVDLTQRRKRGRQLTLLDGTTIKLPTAKKRQPGLRRSDPSPNDELTAADLVAALRAAAHGVDSADMIGESLRWEKMMAAVLTLLLRKHLILERELMEELKKI